MIDLGLCLWKWARYKLIAQEKPLGCSLDFQSHLDTIDSSSIPLLISASCSYTLKVIEWYTVLIWEATFNLEWMNEGMEHDRPFFPKNGNGLRELPSMNCS